MKNDTTKTTNRQNIGDETMVKSSCFFGQSRNEKKKKMKDFVVIDVVALLRRSAFRVPRSFLLAPLPFLVLRQNKMTLLHNDWLISMFRIFIRTNYYVRTIRTSR